jgi:hypothetical protein
VGAVPVFETWKVPVNDGTPTTTVPRSREDGETLSLADDIGADPVIIAMAVVAVLPLVPVTVNCVTFGPEDFGAKTTATLHVPFVASVVQLLPLMAKSVVLPRAAAMAALDPELVTTNISEIELVPTGIDPKSADEGVSETPALVAVPAGWRRPSRPGCCSPSAERS